MVVYRILCDECLDSAVMTTEGCQECPPEELIRPIRNSVFASTMLILLALWFWYSWLPFFPSMEDYISKFFFILTKPKQKSDLDQSYFTSSFKQRIRLLHYVKVLVSYLQVISTFVGFQVPWPSSLSSAMMWCKVTFNFRILSLPGVSCLWKGMEHNTKLMIYTLVPLGLGFMLWMPVLVTFVKKPSSNQESLIQDRFWNAIMLLCFLVSCSSFCLGQAFQFLAGTGFFNAWL
jgi:hypothetical protein